MKKPPRRHDGGRDAGRQLWDPAMTDFRACGTIMGPAGLTAVFGMGTGGAPPVSSPELGRGGSAPTAAVDALHGIRWSATHASVVRHGFVVGRDPRGSRIVADGIIHGPELVAAPGVGRRRVGVAKPLGC